jgi:hypothetical protein
LEFTKITVNCKYALSEVTGLYFLYKTSKVVLVF